MLQYEIHIVNIVTKEKMPREGGETTGGKKVYHGITEHSIRKRMW